MDPEKIYYKLLKHFGKQNWWPAKTRFEVIIGAILTQQTTWKNVEKAICNLKKLKLITPVRIAKADIAALEKAVYSTGFYKQKASRLKKFSEYLIENYNGNLDKFFSRNTKSIRTELLKLDGIGFETADSILLYAGGKEIFVIDAYTKRMCKCHGISNDNYENLRCFFEDNLERDVEIYKEYHAMIVELGKNYCKGKKPLCGECPLELDMVFEHPTN
ncbi:MAG: endonuclease [Candidatus Altiarchaeales archaeon HGW-Altiarchaeales-3]|nr:MAG: endonuclease [Candidatus Altiarchaeales archaeon HGW-Altiarchaeales-3]